MMELWQYFKDVPLQERGKNRLLPLGCTQEMLTDKNGVT